MNEDIKSDSPLIRLTDDDVILEERQALPAHLRLTGNNDGSSIAPSTSEIAHVGPGFARRHAGKSIAFTLSLLSAFSLFGAVRMGLLAGIDPRLDGSPAPVAAAKAPCAGGSCIERVSVSAFQRPRAARVDNSAGMTIAREPAPATAVPTLADPSPTPRAKAHATRVGSTVSVRPSGRPGSPGGIFNDALGTPVATTITTRPAEPNPPPSRVADLPPQHAPVARVKKTASLEDELLNASR